MMIEPEPPEFTRTEVLKLLHLAGVEYAKIDEWLQLVRGELNRRQEDEEQDLG